MKTRPASHDDVPALIALMTTFYAESDFPLPVDNARAAFVGLLDDPRLGGIWLAIDDDDPEPLGHVVLTVGYSMEYGGLRGFVDDLYVRPAARGRGAAGALLGAVRAACVERGVRALHVETAEANTIACHVYARSGFVDSGHLLLTLPLASPTHVG